jgi:hypothetical protein
MKFLIFLFFLQTFCLTSSSDDYETFLEDLTSGLDLINRPGYFEVFGLNFNRSEEG